MNNLEITFLGTSNAVPTKERSHQSVLVSFANEMIMIDCGEGTQRQLKVAEINACKLTRLLITHWHGDHTLGIPGLLQTLEMSQYQKNLQVYGPKGTSAKMKMLEEIYGDLSKNIKVNEIVSGKISNENLFSIETAQMDHGTHTNAYSIILKDKRRLDKKKIKQLKLPNNSLLGELQQGKDIVHNGKKIKSKDVTYIEKGKKITIILDTKFNSKAIALAKNSDILICEATFSDQEKEIASEYKHLTASQAATIAKKAKVSKLILTHISQRYENNLHLIEKEAKKIFPKTTIAKDLDKIII